MNLPRVTMQLPKYKASAIYEAIEIAALGSFLSRVTVKCTRNRIYLGGINNLKNSSFFIFGILGILLLVVFASGCTSLTPQTSSNGTIPTLQTFADGTISFNYPIGFEIQTERANITTEGTGWQDLAYLANKDYIGIVVKKNPEESSAAIVRDGTEQGVREASGQILSTTTETNSNGIVVEKSISQQTDPYTNTVIRYYDMFFSVNGVVYHISVYGDVPMNQQTKETADMIFCSLRII
jgi:hypothetical protein